MTPTFTVLIGSIGRPQLRHALDSIQRQARVPGDQVLVSLDAFEQRAADLAASHARVASYGEGFVSTEYDAGYHWLGVEQINHALRTVPITGSHLFTIGDDDVFLDEAYATLRPICAADPFRPVLYRFLAPWRRVLWDEPRLRRDHISGCCIAAPRVFCEPMHTRREVTHDYDWIVAILAKAQAAGYAPIWLDYIGVVARPDPDGRFDVHHAPLSAAPQIVEASA